jgi:cytochrome oxidase assembly protein ShyY1
VAVFGVVNLVLIILVGLAVWIVRRGKKEAEFQLVEEDDQAVAEESAQ